MAHHEDSDPIFLVVVTGWTGAGKTTIAELVAREIGATVASFDWLMSGLRIDPHVWNAVELPVERQRRTGWNLLSRVAEQQLRRGSSCVLDLVCREEIRAEWAELAERYGASFRVIECVCANETLHRSRVEGRDRDIPGWYELDWDRVAMGRQRYVPIAGPKLQIDAETPVNSNLNEVMRWLTS
ncbi:MAG: ATP-binding protein [Sulfitobacter sp.]|nr:ATP-binding protein [Sulfitobacter sp.]